MADAPTARSEAIQSEAAPMRERVLVEVKPHRWAVSWWARLYRRFAKRWHVDNHIRNFCVPFTVEGQENLEGLTGPMLIIAGEEDHTVAPAISHATYKIQSRNPGTTEEIVMPSRGHSLTIDSGWRAVADEALAFVQRFIQ